MVPAAVDEMVAGMESSSVESMVGRTVVEMESSTADMKVVR